MNLLHEQYRTCTLDLIGNLAVQVGRHAGDATRNDFSALGHEAPEQIRVFVINGFKSKVDASAWHRLVCLAEIRAALWCFWLHGRLFDFAVQCVTAKKWIVLLLLKAPGCAEAFFVACCDVAGWGGAFGARFRAFKCDDVSCHDVLLCLVIVVNFTARGQSLESLPLSSSSSPSSSDSPKRDVTGTRARKRFCFSSSAWHSTV